MTGENISLLSKTYHWSLQALKDLLFFLDKCSDDDIRWGFKQTDKSTLLLVQDITFSLTRHALDALSNCTNGESIANRIYR
jgi:hypothetical protein